MKVKAIGSSDKWVGYYGLKRRRGGDVFTLDKESDFSEQWMEKVPAKTPESKPSSFKDLGVADNRKSEAKPDAPEEESESEISDEEELKKEKSSKKPGRKSAGDQEVI